MPWFSHRDSDPHTNSIRAQLPALAPGVRILLPLPRKLSAFAEGLFFFHGSLIGIPGPPRAAAPIRKICGPVRRPGPPEQRTGPASPGQRRPGGPLRRLLPVCPPGGTARRGLPADHGPRQQSAYDRHPPGRTVRRQPGHHGPGGRISGPAVLIP